MRSRYGASPQIDLDKQIARTRVAQPMQLDFALIAQRVRENNMGVGGIHVESDVTFTDGRVVFSTGQWLPFEGSDPPQPGWYRLRVLDYDDPSKTRLSVAAPQPQPQPQPAADGAP